VLRRLCVGEKWLQYGVLIDGDEESSTRSNGGLNSYIEDGLVSRDAEARISSGYLEVASLAVIKRQVSVLIPKCIKIFLSAGVGVIKAARVLTLTRGCEVV
jgi:hypothetical protein